MNGHVVPIPVFRTIKSIGIYNKTKNQSDTRQKAYENSEE